jgi:thiol-disulfide isomerase/thioredoxin
MKRVLFLAFLAACGRPTFPASASHALLNQKLPDLTARETLDGSPLDAKALEGKPVVVKFFAEYCKPCKETLPAVESLAKQYGDVVFIGMDEDESNSTARELVKQYGLTFPVVHDQGRFRGRFRVTEMPMTFVADKTGLVRWVGDERQTEADLRRAVEAAR